MGIVDSIDVSNEPINESTTIMTVAGRYITLVAVLAFVMIAGCDAPDPNGNTPTSGRLILYVDEAYAPLVKMLADTFMTRSPNAHIEIRVAPARMAIQGLLNVGVARATNDTLASVAAVIGRTLLRDEHDMMN